MTDTDVTLRPATYNDLEFLFEVIWTFRQSRELSDQEEEFSVFKENFDPDAVKVVQYQGRDVGRLRFTEEPGRLYVGGIQILPIRQRLTVSSAIFGYLQAKSKDAGLPIESEVHTQNNHTRRLYQRLGFSIVGWGKYTNRRTEGYYWKMRRLP